MKKMTDAEKARLKRLSAGRGALANGKLSMDEQLELQGLKKKAKASTSYSPKPMSDAAKRKASRAGAEKARQYTDLPARRPSPNPARTSYSPQQMTEFDKRKASAAGAASKKASSARKVEKLKSMGLKKTNLDKTSRGPKSGTATASKVVKRVKTVAREAGDVKKAIKNVAKSGKAALDPSYSGIRNLGRQAVRETGKDLGKQLRELGSAVKSGKPGKRAGTVSYNADTGTPQGLLKRRAPKTNFRPQYSSEYGGPYTTRKKKK